MRLFKYCDSNGTKVFERRAIKLAHPRSLNDPFDLQPSPDLSEESKQAIIQGAFAESELAQLSKAGVSPMLPAGASVQDTWRQWGEASINNTDNFDHMYKTLLSVFNEIGIICFTEHGNNHLMWAHYAEKHMGLVIEIETEGLFDTPGTLQPLKANCAYRVGYALEKPKFSFHRDSPEAFLTKGLEWQYESEWRVLFYLEEISPEVIDGNEMYLHPVDPKQIRSVRMGCNMTTPKKTEVWELLHGEAFRHVEIYEMKPDPLRFVLTPVRLR